MNFLTNIILASYFVHYVAGHGKEEGHPHLSPAVLNAIAPPPKAEPQLAVQSVATCYQGYTLMSDGTCVKEIVEEPTPAEGDITVPYITRCPVGYTPSDGKCSKTKEGPLAYFCPVGYEDDGIACSQTIPGEIVTSCNEGELVNGVCVAMQRAPYLVTPKCPEGSQVEKDGNCWKIVETFDCTPRDGKEVTGRVIAPQKPAPLGKKIWVSKGKGGAKLRALHAKKDKKDTEDTTRLPYIAPSKNSIHGKFVEEQDVQTTTPPPLSEVVVPTACPKKELVSVTPPRPTKIAPVSQTCAKKIVVDAEAVVRCPEGFEDFGDSCVKQTTTPPTTLCLSNGLTEGACPPVVRRLPKIAECPSGIRTEDDRCVEVTYASAQNVCAERFRDTGTGCTAVIKSGGLECRPGLSLVGKQCVGKSVRPSIAVDLKAPPSGCVDKY